MPVCSPREFHFEARWQRTCAKCGRPGQFQAHHVVDKAKLEKMGLKGNRLYDPRNALRLCQALGDVNRRCHFQHENRVEGAVVLTAQLLDCNIEYAFEVLGPHAADYLRQEYDDRDPDPRIERQLTAMLEAA